MAKKSIYEMAAREASKDLRAVMSSFGDVNFMRDDSSPKTKARRELLASMSPDLQQMQADGMPMYVLEKLARMDVD